MLIAEAVEVPKVELSTLVKVDLEGDGTDEILFAGTYQARSTVPGYADYWDSVERVPHHVVGVRAISDGAVVIIMLARYEAHPASPEGPALLGLVDLEGDGTLEVVTQERGDHSWSAQVHLVRYDEPLQILGSTGCAY